MGGAGRTIEVMMAGILTVAIISVLVSQKATTVSLVQAISSALSSIFSTVVSPVTGGSATTTTGG